MFHQISFVLYLLIFQLVNKMPKSLDSQKKKKKTYIALSFLLLFHRLIKFFVIKLEL